MFVRGQIIHSFNTGNMLYNLFAGNSSHTDCHSSNIYLFVHGFRSENGDHLEMKRLKQSLSLLFYNGALSNGVGGGTDLFPIQLKGL